MNIAVVSFCSLEAAVRVGMFFLVEAAGANFIVPIARADADTYCIVYSSNMPLHRLYGGLLGYHLSH